MKLLVTGGAGFMGSNFIRYMLSRHEDLAIVNFDKLTYAGNLENLADVADHDRYSFVKGDIADRRAVDELVAAGSFDALVNYAAETHVDRSIYDPGAFLRTDVLGTHSLLEAVRSHGVSRMIQISTDEVYGDVEEGVFTEESPFRPSSPYSASKAGGDHLCHAYHRTWGTPVIVTHSVNVYGPYQYPEKLIPLFVTNLIEGKNVPVYGDGAQVREWIHVLDHARAIEALLEKGRPGQAYNIGTNVEKQNIEITKALLEQLGMDESRIEHVADRAGHDVRYALDHGKIASEVGWRPEVAFDKGLAETVDWYRDHEAWWKPIKDGSFKEYYLAQYEGR